MFVWILLYEPTRNLIGMYTASFETVSGLEVWDCIQTTTIMDVLKNSVSLERLEAFDLF